ncbi:MAG: hypothetical protein WDO16_10115 [Bacteroidota bacterium]
MMTLPVLLITYFDTMPMTINTNPFSQSATIAAFNAFGIMGT